MTILEWRCPEAACRLILGEVRDGTLVLFVPAASVSATGVVVPCPRCLRQKVWFVARRGGAEGAARGSAAHV